METNWIKMLLKMSAPNGGPASGKLKAEEKEELSSYLAYAALYNRLVLEMLRIQGIEKTLEDLRKMPHFNLLNCTDGFLQQIWDSHVDLGKNFPKTGGPSAPDGI